MKLKQSRKKAKDIIETIDAKKSSGSKITPRSKESNSKRSKGKKESDSQEINIRKKSFKRLKISSRSIRLRQRINIFFNEIF